MQVIEKPNLHPRLMAYVLRALCGIVEASETITAVNVKLRGVVWLLPYLDGRGYAQICRMTGAMIEGEPAPIDLLVITSKSTKYFKPCALVVDCQQVDNGNDA